MPQPSLSSSTVSDAEPQVDSRAEFDLKATRAGSESREFYGQP